MNLPKIKANVNTFFNFFSSFLLIADFICFFTNSPSFFFLHLHIHICFIQERKVYVTIQLYSFQVFFWLFFDFHTKTTCLTKKIKYISLKKYKNKNHYPIRFLCKNKKTLIFHFNVPDKPLLYLRTFQ